MNTLLIDDVAQSLFRSEVSKIIGEAVSDLVGAEGDIVYGKLINSLAHSADQETSIARKTLLLSAIDRLIGDENLLRRKRLVESK
ncbi:MULTISPECIES: hypothetical protein [Hafnia]|nr:MULTISPECIES: hypothetical protein [Hafnia]AJQ99572.1 hypothetical protein F652_1583 [Enterobacteriaceae bacterium bta3-1]OFS09395.1 hypothetical protein HMPREF3091_14340 [Hafnia sp. HMSC23F03]QQE45170.1 hypothetical protein I6H95_07745 [Hafnia alvei]TBM20871.1 hypothetical protein EYY89_20945 [Hafnia paralvei]